MKVFHAADLHYCPKHLKWVHRAFDHAAMTAIGAECDVAVIAGDSFDHSVGLHEPSVSAYLSVIINLSQFMPLLILQGTYSHDRPGSLDILKGLPTRYPIHVADKAEQITLAKLGDDLVWITPTMGEVFDSVPLATFSCLPSLNKADPEIRAIGARQYVKNLADEWNLKTPPQIPAILVTHGTVNGCRTESGYAMVSPDWEFDTDTLFAFGTDAVMMGHIHAHQRWDDKGQVIAYPGSIARLVHGDHADKGFLIWDLGPDDANKFEFHKTPTRELLEIEFDGPPVMEELVELAAQADSDASVRIRWSVDQEYASSVDKKQIKALFSHVDQLNLEGVINPVQSVRAAGISTALTMEEKLGYFVVTIGDEGAMDQLSPRLQMLQSQNVSDITKTILKEQS